MKRFRENRPIFWRRQALFPFLALLAGILTACAPAVTVPPPAPPTPQAAPVAPAPTRPEAVPAPPVEPPAQPAEHEPPAAVPEVIPPETPEVEPAGPREPYDLSYILGLGDSTTYGRGSSADGPPTDYLSRLIDLLQGPWLAVNRGLPSAKTSVILERSERFFKQTRPGLTIISVGLNDAVFQVPVEETMAGVEALAAKVLDRGGRLLMSTTTPVRPDKRPAQFKRLEILNQRIRDLAQKKGWPLEDLWRGFLDTPNWNTALLDPEAENHPNDRGYELMARLFLRTIRARNLLLGDLEWVVLEPLHPAAAGNGMAPAPPVLLSDAASPLAGDDISAMTALDADGDGADEIAVIRSGSGKQTFLLYGVGITGSPPTAEVRLLASDEWAYPAGGWITHLVRIDLEGDGRDEIGLVRWNEERRSQTLEVWEVHAAGTDSKETASRARRLWVDNGTVTRSGRLRDIAALQADGDPALELAVLLGDPTGAQTVVVLDTPAGQAAPPAIAEWYLVGDPVLRLAGQDLDGDRIDELLLLRTPKAGLPDILEAYSLAALPAPGAPAGAAAPSTMARASLTDARTFALAPLRLRLDGAIRGALTLWRNR